MEGPIPPSDWTEDLVRADRPNMLGYGLLPPDQGVGLLPWSFVDERMAAAKNYWIATAGDGGRPHAAPVWGLWHEGRFYFSTGGDSRKAVNLTANPSMVVHLESGDEVVILEGRGERVESNALLKTLDDSYQGKYGVDMSAGLVFALRADKVLAWREADFPGSATRWRLSG